MNDILDTIGAQDQEPFPLENLIPQAMDTFQPPIAAVRNRAAQAAMLTGKPEEAIDKYQAYMSSGMNGDQGPAQMAIDAFHKQDKSLDMEAVMGVLADPKLSIEQKRGAIDAAKGSKFLSDAGTSLLSKGLSAESPGETQEAEDARISTSDMLREMYDAKEQIQGIVNAHGASLSSETGGAALDMYAAILAPFTTSVRSFKLARALAESTGKKFSVWDGIKAATFEAGQTTEDARTQLASLSPAARVEYAKKLVEAITNNSGYIPGSDNQFAQYMKATEVFEEGGYSDTAKYLDNVSFLLDAVGFGGLIKQGVRGATPSISRKAIAEDAGFSTRFTPKNDIIDVFERIENNSLVRRENPASVASTANNANPQQAREIHAAVVRSTDDATAEAMYGTSKTQAVINDVYPQAVTESGNVTAKATDIQRAVRPKIALEDEMRGMIIDSDVAIHYSLEELALARSNIVNDFSSATDLVPNDAMGGFRSGFNLDGSGVEISAVYGTKEGAFTNAKQAFDQARLGLRGQGVLDSEITVLRKQGLDYVPVKLEEVGDEVGSYLVRVTMRREVDPTDITRTVDGVPGHFDPDDVKLNFLDRLPLAVWDSHGSASRWLFDAASMLSPRVTGAASVATDVTSNFEKKMLNIADKFADKFNDLPSARKTAVDAYIREANFKGIPFDTADLTMRNFNAEEIAAIRSWRDFWDAQHFLENHDAIRSLNSQGFQLFKTQTDELYAKPIPKNSTVGRVYDPASGTVAELTPQALDNLYNTGGTLAKLRRPASFNVNTTGRGATRTVGTTTEYMMVRNTPTEYLRKFRDTDQVLNYRDGYYQIQYKASRFVDEITLGKNGEELSRRAIAVAGDTETANHFVSRQAPRAGIKYLVRADDKAAMTGGNDWFDTNAARGRIAQKHRGKLLEDATGINHLGDGNYIVSPMESAIRAARSISGRTVNRPMLEATKARFMDFYGDVLPSNGYGGKLFPSSSSQIGAKGQAFTKHVAAARTNWEYINYLENAYINTIDKFTMQLFKVAGEFAGEKGLSRIERMANRIGESGEGPTSIAKGIVFQAYIGTNPLRNWIVQPQQAMRTFAYNPQVWLSGQMGLLLGDWIAFVGRGPSAHTFSKEGWDFVQFVSNSGLIDSIDKQNLVRGSLLQAADASSRTQRIASEIAQAPRKLGFDLGESINLLGHAAAVFDKYRRAGKDISSKIVHREMHSEVRAISYEMNFAGDMVYNQTSAAMLLQFLQVPHKAILQITNRRVPTGIESSASGMKRLGQSANLVENAKARMILGDFLLWGAAGSGITALVSTVMGGDSLPDDPVLRETYLNGLTSTVLNTAMNEMLDEKDVNGKRINTTGIDTSSLSPYAWDGWAKVFIGGYSGGPYQMLLNSPAGQLFLADGSRFKMAIGSMMNFMNPFDPTPRTPEQALSVLNEVAKISSGWNNLTRARQAYFHGKIMDKNGNVIDGNVNAIEAAGLVFGFGTSDTHKFYNTQRFTQEGSKEYRDEVLSVYKSAKLFMQVQFDRGIQDPKQMQAVINMALKPYADSPIAIDIIQKEWSKDLMGKDQQLLFSMMKSAGLPQYGLTVDAIKQSSVSDEQKAQFIEQLNAFKNARSAIKKDK